MLAKLPVGLNLLNDFAGARHLGEPAACLFLLANDRGSDFLRIELFQAVDEAFSLWAGNPLQERNVIRVQNDHAMLSSASAPGAEAIHGIRGPDALPP
jgi:hypothetical protein